MRQVLHDLRSGRIEVAEVPAPGARPGHLLIRTAATLVSPGTERMLVAFGRASLLAKARSQPDRVRQVLAKARTDGVRPALEAVASRLGEPVALGYCNAGVVLAAGDGVTGFRAGDRVLSNGPHAEIACVPATLAAAIPDGVDDEDATFAVLGAISLNGVRLLEPALGETFAVVGLGVLGLLAVQLLRASGCRVLAIDVDAARCDLARALGAEAACVVRAADPVRAADELTRGRGVDGVLIAAAADGDEIVSQAARMCRKRGRIVLVGVVGLRLRRHDFYEKEISFRVACSYGPGRYDAGYEEGGRDYPIGFVRWTVARNFEAVLGEIAAGRLRVGALVSRRIPIAEAGAAYEAILADRGALGVVLTYPDGPAPTARTTAVAAGAARAPTVASAATAASGPSAMRGERDRASEAGSEAPQRRLLRFRPAAARPPRAAVPVVGFIGSGQFARKVLLPALAAAGARIASIASAGGMSSLVAARRFGAAAATTDAGGILADPAIDAVFIATRHDSHARLVAAALRAGKHVFVEKPLALDETELALVRDALADAGDRLLHVGFNRRFAPLALEAQRLLAGRAAPIAIAIAVNAGAVPDGHWTRDPAVGGGRIAGEACHFIDLAAFLAGAPIAGVRALPLGAGGAGADSASIQIAFTDGSLATIQYLANGPASFPKERVEVFSEGRALAIDNWRRLVPYGWPGARRRWGWQDKGHREQVARFVRAVEQGGPPLVPFAEIEAVTRATIAAARAEGFATAREREPVAEATPEAGRDAVAADAGGAVEELSEVVA